MKILERYKKKILNHHKKTILKANMAKTSTSSTLIAAGLILVQKAMSMAELDPQLLILGAILLAIGYAVNYYGDMHKVEKKKEEIDILNDAIRAAYRKVMHDVEESVTSYFKEEIEKRIYETLDQKIRKQRKTEKEE